MLFVDESEHDESEHNINQMLVVEWFSAHHGYFAYESRKL